ncbi:D-alanyl-D-alanine carboxypeptidase family protein [Paenibacillus thermoaerophilus]|uniref:serine-type D-Ala-D-Ala carboxypeptidase n=1 Tax=Paenibacillus thermoaerophilus TaxID=1215385 RepID=A0ABW2V6T0_9BACL|nr:D-alanyl-D-alanine carboxypeptidase family protein [Paenibacillus thermoaerophilus]TMV12456.1 D-alanyl-D-alanine carboxypeptidase [Paenibacillus thermoaerophilus]
MNARFKTYAKRVAQILSVSLLVQAASVSIQASMPKTYAAEAPALNLEVESAILIEATTGQVIYEYNADTLREPASMAKMMTEYLVMEAIESGKIKWDDMVTTSKYAASVGGSGGLLAANEKLTVDQMFKAMSIYSGNDATIALAEFLEGSEEAFARKMNETARKIGMSDGANFITSTGLPRYMTDKLNPSSLPGETVMTARDAAILARRIILDHPQVLEYTKIPKLKLRERDKTEMTNWNWMLETYQGTANMQPYVYPGLDGLKTGHTNEAGYCFTGTAVRNGMRLISVVMGAKTEPKRFQETRKLLDYGFNNFELKTMLAANTPIDGQPTVKISKGKKTEIPVVSGGEAKFIARKGSEDKPEITVETKSADELKAPFDKGAEVGTITVKYNGVEQKVPLVAAEEAEKGGWFRLFFRAIGNFFSDLFSGIASGIKGLFS